MDINITAEELLKPVHQFEIRLASDGRWKTTVKCSSSKSGLKTLAKTDKDKLLNALLDYYNLNMNEQKKHTTLSDIFPEWLQIKMNHTNRPSYIKKLISTWNNYYIPDPISVKPLCDFTELYLDGWLCNLVKTKKLTKKGYANITIILRGCLDYACRSEIGLLSSNPIKNIKMNPKLFRATRKPMSSTQVFSTREQLALMTQALYNYNQYHKTTTPLMILLNFYLGLRIGELCAIKWSDIEGDYLHVQHMEITDYNINTSFISAKENGYIVIDQLKTVASERYIYLTNEAKEILEEVKKYNNDKGWYDDDFIFLNCKTHTRTTTDAVSTYLQTLCKQAGLPSKSSHKIRKSWILILVSI